MEFEFPIKFLSKGFPVWMYLPCWNLSVPLPSFPFAVVLYQLPVSENSTCTLLGIIAKWPVTALLNILHDSHVKQSVCKFNKASLTRRSLFMSPTCTPMRSTSLLSPEIKVCLRRKKLEWLPLTTFIVDYNDEIQKVLILRDMFWLDTIVFCKENILNKSHKKTDMKILSRYLNGHWQWNFFYLCVWRRPQLLIKKKQNTFNILHIMWKETKLHSFVLNGRKERMRGRQKGRKEKGKE